MNLPHVAQLLREKKPLRVVCYGDSISEVGRSPQWHGGASAAEKNWGQQLGALLKAAYPDSTVTVLNYGIGGHNSYEGLGRLDGLLPLKPDLVLIEFGANDCCYHYLLPEETKLAQQTLAQWAHERTGADVMILGVAGDNPLQPFFLHLNETAKAIREAAAAVNVPYVDLRAAVLKATDDGKRWAEFHLAAGNCHPNDAGHRVWAEAVFAAVQGALIGQGK